MLIYIQLMNTIIFDVDGTLVDSVDLHARAWQETFRRFGKEIDFEDVRQQIGKGGDQLIPVFFTEKEIEEFGEEMEEFRKTLFRENYLHRVRPFPKVRELFERIKADKKKIALASSSPKKELDHYKRITEIEDLIDEETSADDVNRSKPHPDVFLEALEKAGEEKPEHAIVVGDTPHDVNAASKAELKVVGLLCGGFSKEQLAGCVALYKDPAELLAHYHKSPLVVETVFELAEKRAGNF